MANILGLSRTRVSVILNFLVVFFITTLLVEVTEVLLEEHFGLDVHGWLSLGGFGVVVMYGFKFHILCCVLPAIVAAYRCKHKCDHEHCKEDGSGEDNK